MKALEKVAPRHAKAARTESEQWFICCPECGNSKSVAELGGIRYRAASRGKRTYGMCSRCGKRRWLKWERRYPDGRVEPG
jgi:hypothetical protein